MATWFSTGICVRGQRRNGATKQALQTTGLHFESGIVDPRQTGIDPNDKTWQGDQSALHSEQDLARALGARRRAMGYDDDGF